jgi:hypothetical protein
MMLTDFWRDYFDLVWVIGKDLRNLWEKERQEVNVVKDGVKL